MMVDILRSHKSIQLFPSPRAGHEFDFSNGKYVVFLRGCVTAVATRRKAKQKNGTIKLFIFFV